ncbi:polyamine ABC transporter substrate-binding protein (plasmid) [Bradyrhizobium sp. 62B]|uniref:polyamine ABC transporter substrate-binding protein n=1 Tax=Bradyrhizobium sp. 62B TaxID=2898442 RepID=UPI002557EC3B|nr:polyamine ABC transporter substrate-binding protein [Bradyrhizobium sp. 62B]
MRKSLIVAGTLALTGLAAILAPTKAVFAGDQLTITSFGGATQAAERKAFFEPFAKHAGVKVLEEEYNGEVAKIRAMVESKTVSWDVVSTDATTAVQMCAEGTVETLDWKKLGLDRSKLAGAEEYECAVPEYLYSHAIAYDKDKLPNGPKTMADFFDLRKFPGKRGLIKSPFGNIEWALIADGVSVKDIYKILNTPEGIDRAFAKLNTIKKDVIWWQSNAQSLQIIADGEVTMGKTATHRVYDANKTAGKHLETVWDGQGFGAAVWVVPKGSARLDDAYKFLAFASSPQAQADLTRYVPLAPVNKDAISLVDPSILPYLPNAPDHMTNAFLVNNTFWANKGDELRQRFNAWLAK